MKALDLHKKTNKLMYLTILCMLYALIVVEWNYYEERSLYGMLILTIGYLLGTISCFKHLPKKLPAIIIIAIIYGFFLTISILCSNIEINFFQDLIRNSTWIIMFCMSYIWGIKNYNFNIVVNTICYFVLPLMYLIYLFILTKTFFIGLEFGFRDAIIPVAVLSPIPLLSPNNKIRNTHVGIIVFLTLLSAKRSVILGVILGLIVYFSKFYRDSRYKKKIVLWFILIGTGLSGLFMWGNLKLDIFNIAFSRFEDMLDGNSSGRDNLAEVILGKYSESDIFTQLLGHGSHTTIAIVDKLTHNDFLQVLYDYGLIPLIFFLIMYVILIFKGYILYFNFDYLKKRSAIYCYTLVSFIFFGMFNCYISNPQTFTLSMVIFGYLIGQFQYLKNKHYNL